jgi:hypothetical protein
MKDHDFLEDFIAEIEEYHGSEVGAAARRALSGLQEMGLAIKQQDPVPTKGLGIGVIEPRISSWNATLLVGHGRGGQIGWELLRLRSYNPFRIAGKEAELRRMLEAIPGFIDRPDYPAVEWRGIAEGGLEPFLEAASWTAERIRKSNPAG